MNYGTGRGTVDCGQVRQDQVLALEKLLIYHAGFL